jgi:hypothetical protein
MARQRINPEGVPDRVFQPVATPVNLYYQPNLSQVELSRTAQIIDAFKQFSPQLERFTSDIVAVGIQKEKQIGAMEAAQGPLDAANAKAAQAIEKAGGLTPWRYEAFLDTLGRRAVREKYQAWLYQNVDDLSALANPDGTIRDGTYAQQRMAEAYQEQVASQFGAGSYFAARAAADEKLKIDSQFMPAIQARHAEKLKEQNLADAKDEMFAILSSHSTMSLLPTVDDGREDSFVKEQIKGVMEQYRRVTGTSGAKPFTDALLEWANSQAADGDFEGALTTLRAFETEDGKFRVMGIELGAAYNAQIKSNIDALEEKRDQSKLRDLQISELMARESLRKAMNLADGELAKMAQSSPSGTIVMTPDQIIVMAGALVDSMEDVPEDRKETMKAEAATQIRVKVAGLNAMGQDIPSVIDTIKRAAESGDYVLADMLLDQAKSDRTISDGTANEIRGDIKSEAARSEILPGYQATSQLRITEFGLPGNMDSITESEKSDVMLMLGVAQEELKSKINAGWKEIVGLPQEERAKAAAELISKSKREVVEKFKVSHKDLLDRADLRRSKDAVLSSQPLETQIKASSEFIGATIGVENANPTERLKAEQWINNRVRTVFGEELDKLLKDGMPPDQALRKIEQETRVLTRKVMEEVENPSNPNVHISVRRLVGSTTALDTGVREPTEAEAKAGVQAGLAGVVQEMSQLRREVPGLSIGFDWVDRTIVPAVASMERMVEEAKSKAQKGTPDAPQALEEAKRFITVMAKDSIENVLKIQASPSLRESLRGGATVPLYTVRDGSVFMWNGNSGQYELSQQMTDNISKLRGITGYSMDEIRSGTSKEGLRIDYAKMDPSKDLLVQSGDDMLQLVQEYEASEGKSGVLVDWIQAKISTGQMTVSPEQILDAQHRLLRQRVPNFTKPLSQFTK